MRGWIYVASAAGGGGRVRIGHSPVDPAHDAAALGGAWSVDYDAVVDTPRDVVALVHARLAPLATRDGAYRCSPEFAIAAIHHALGGPPPGERIHADGPLHGTPGGDPLDALVALHGHRARREHGGPLPALAGPALVLSVAVAVVFYVAWRPAPTPAPAVDAQAPEFDAHASASDTHAPAFDTRAPARAPVGEGGPNAAAHATPPSPAASLTAADCAVLWVSLLPRCAALPRHACRRAQEHLPDPARELLASLRGGGAPFDAAAFANFCRAACRHGYRPSRDDFAFSVCGATGQGSRAAERVR